MGYNLLLMCECRGEIDTVKSSLQKYPSSSVKELKTLLSFTNLYRHKWLWGLHEDVTMIASLALKKGINWSHCQTRVVYAGFENLKPTK